MEYGLICFDMKTYIVFKAMLFLYTSPFRDSLLLKSVIIHFK